MPSSGTRKRCAARNVYAPWHDARLLALARLENALGARAFARRCPPRQASPACASASGPPSCAVRRIRRTPLVGCAQVAPASGDAGSLRRKDVPYSWAANSPPGVTEPACALGWAQRGSQVRRELLCRRALGSERSSTQHHAQGGCAQDRVGRNQECAPPLAPACCVRLTVARAAAVQAKSSPRRWWCVATSHVRRSAVSLDALRFWQANEAKYVVKTYNRPPIVFTRGKGCVLYDTNGGCPRGSCALACCRR